MLVLASALLATLVGAAAGETLSYQCTIKGARANEWVQPTIFFGHDTATRRVVVSDPSILAFNAGQPVEGRLVADTPSRITFAWELDVRSRGNRRLALEYRATYVKGTGKVSVLAKPRTSQSGMSNRGGTCVVRKLSG